MKLLLSHIADLDGISPIILMNLIGEEFEYQLFEVKELSSFIQENIETTYFNKYDKIYITDLGITKECADIIVNSKYKDKFKLFDHHETHYYLNDYEFATVYEEINGFKECGTTIFFKYLMENNSDILSKDSIIHYVELVREIDTWQFTELENEARDLNSIFDFYGREDFIERYSKFLNENNSFYFTEIEQIILKSLNKKKQDFLESYKDKVKIRKICGYNVGIVFANKNRSELGNYLAELYKDSCDIICMIDLERHVSIRGIKLDKPTNTFAEYFNGGGHPLASGMPLADDILDKVIDLIYGDKLED